MKTELLKRRVETYYKSEGRITKETIKYVWTKFPDGSWDWDRRETSYEVIYVDN